MWDPQAFLFFLATWTLFSLPISAVGKLPGTVTPFRVRICFILLSWSALAALVSTPLWKPRVGLEVWAVEALGVTLATWAVFLLPIWLLNQIRLTSDRLKPWIYMVLVACAVGLSSAIPTWDCHDDDPGRPALGRHCHPLWGTLHMH